MQLNDVKCLVRKPDRRNKSEPAHRISVENDVIAHFFDEGPELLSVDFKGALLPRPQFIHFFGEFFFFLPHVETLVNSNRAFSLNLEKRDFTLPDLNYFDSIPKIRFRLHLNFGSYSAFFDFRCKNGHFFSRFFGSISQTDLFSIALKHSFYSSIWKCSWAVSIDLINTFYCCQLRFGSSI